MTCERTRTAWAIRWDYRDGRGPFLVGSTIHPCRTRLFETRREAREHIDQEFGYIRHRADLRGPPHNWRMPQVVRVIITIQEAP